MKRFGKNLMRAAVCAAVIALLFGITACKQFTADIEEELGYWAAEVIVADYSFSVPYQTSNDGALCIPSSGPVTLTIKLRNPKNFTIVTPTSSADVIRFPGLTTQPTHGSSNDYTLVQAPDKQELQLTYKSGFLKDHEWSKGNIGPEITLMSADGRTFNKKFSLNLKVNTAPALEYAGIGKTATADASGNQFYVLLFCAKDMGTMIGSPGESVHKDINTMNVTAGGVSLSPITLSITGSEFSSSSSTDILASTAVASLDGSSLPSPTPQDWILRLKTDVKVGGAAKEYDVSIKDEQGLSSAVIRASTQKNKLPKVKLFDGPTEITGTLESSLKEFSGTSGKNLTAKVTDAPAGTAITGSIAKYEGGTWTQISGGTVSGTTTAEINLPALGTSIYEARYKITLKA